MKIVICGGRDIDRVDAMNWLNKNAIDEMERIKRATGAPA